MQGFGRSEAAKAFLSTLPVRGATYPTPDDLADDIFLSTLPVRGATVIGKYIDEGFAFLSTLPVRGATRPRAIRPGVLSYFYPRSP